MGAGGSVSAPPRVPARPPRRFPVTDHTARSLPDAGVGRVAAPSRLSSSFSFSFSFSSASPFPPPGAPGAFAWFVEDLDRPGEWDIYPPDVCARLDRALATGQAECAIVSRKRMCAVNVQSMEETGARVRRVRRAAAEEFVSPDGTVRLREKRSVAVDPFAEECDAELEEVVNAASEERFAAEETTATGSTTTEMSNAFPRLLRSIKVHARTAFTLAHAPHGRRALLTGTVRQLFHWDIDTAEAKTCFDVSGATALAAVYTPSGERVLCGASDAVVRLFDTEKSAPRHLLHGHTGKVYGVDYFDDESRIATVSVDCTVRYWDLETRLSLIADACYTKPVFALATSKKCNWLAITGGDDCFISAHDFRIGKHSVTAQFLGHTKTVWTCNWRPDELQFVSAGIDRTLHVWDVRSPAKPLLIVRHHSLSVHYAEFMPNGRGILSAARDTSVRLTNATTGDAVWRATAHKGIVFRAKLNASTGIMATCGADKNVNIWEYSNLDKW